MDTARPSRVLLVVSGFPPSIEMGAQTCWQIARNLPRHGWTPVVLTKDNPHVTYRDPASAAPEREMTVVRTGMWPHPVQLLRRLRAGRTEEAGAAGEPETISPGPRRGWLRRAVLAALNVPDTETGWIPPAVLAGRRVVRRSDISCLLSSGPAWSSHLVALGLARLSGLPWVAHFRDPWSQGSIYAGESEWADRANGRLERAVVCRATTVICVTDRHTGLLRRHYASCPPDKFVTVPNGYDGAEWDEASQDITVGNQRDRDGRFVVTYAGALYAGRSPLLVLEALRRLGASGAVDPKLVRIDVIVYDGVSQLPDGRDIMMVARQMGLGDSVQVLGPLTRRETLRRLLESDLLLQLGHNFTVQVPGKLYEYLRSGRPILAVVPTGAQTDLLRATGGAWIVEPDDMNAAVEAVGDAYRRWQDGQPGPPAKPELVKGFDRRVLVARIAAELETATARVAAQRARR